MKWSWRVGRVLGIDLYIHYTFVLLLAWVFLRQFLAGGVEGEGRGAVGPAAWEVVFICGVFATVVLHELGHALAARRFGIPTRDITLLPIGGVARLERMPEKPAQELVVALAGPAVNVVLAVLCFGLLLATGRVGNVLKVDMLQGDLAARFFLVNVFLVVFNLLPAFPMDGGRVLRALLAMTMDYTQATQVAATIGQGMALVFGFIGLFFNPLLVFVALFVWIGAAQEASMVQMKTALGGIPVRRAMITRYQALRPEDSLATAAKYVLDGFQQDFPVMDGERVVGVLTRADLVRGLSEQGEETPVAEYMTEEFETADPAEMLEGVLGRLQGCACHSAPVLRDGRLEGLITQENIGEFLMIQAALKKRGPGDRGTETPRVDQAEVEREYF